MYALHLSTTVTERTAVILQASFETEKALYPSPPTYAHASAGSDAGSRLAVAVAVGERGLRLRVGRAGGLRLRVGGGRRCGLVVANRGRPADAGHVEARGRRAGAHRAAARERRVVRVVRDSRPSPPWPSGRRRRAPARAAAPPAGQMPRRPPSGGPRQTAHRSGPGWCGPRAGEAAEGRTSLLPAES